MATSSEGKIDVEYGQTLHDYAVMTDSGDHMLHTISGGTIYSKKSGYEVSIRPNGMVTGRNVLSTHATSDYVTIAGFTAYSKGKEWTVEATSLEITRPASDVSKINSVTMTDAGVAAIVAGTDGATTEFSTTRGAAGGPPEIPADSVEIGQIRVVAAASAAIAASEIFQNVGDHTERFDYPAWKVRNLGDGDLAATAAKKNAYVELTSALDPIHASATYKQVYIKYYSPTFIEIPRAMDFVPAEISYSTSSTQYYRGILGSVSSSFGAASFNALMDDNITDSLMGLKDSLITVRYYPDENKAPFILSQGTLGVARTFPVDNENLAACTLACTEESINFTS